MTITVGALRRRWSQELAWLRAHTLGEPWPPVGDTPECPLTALAFSRPDLMTAPTVGAWRTLVEAA